MHNITLLGDVHLGRRFQTGVPLHRRGDREALQWKDFIASLDCDTEFHIQVGDLFDGFAVPEALLLAVADAYRMAAFKNKRTTYVILRGNHDASRDTSKASSFDVLAELLRPAANIQVLSKVTAIATRDKSLLGFLPWHPFKTSEELAQELLNLNLNLPYRAVFGHFEVKSYGGDDSNLIPAKTLSTVTKHIVTGHIHTPDQFEQDGVNVTVVGSMQPYSHAEDLLGELYETLPLENVISEEKPQRFFHMNLRVLVRDGEVVPEVDCLSLITRKVAEVEEAQDLKVEFEEFNMSSLFSACLFDAGVGPGVAARIAAKFEELKNA